jgi:hypothetical protein
MYKQTSNVFYVGSKLKACYFKPRSRVNIYIEHNFAPLSQNHVKSNGHLELASVIVLWDNSGWLRGKHQLG